MAMGGRNIIDIILRLVDQLSPGYKRAADTVQKGGQQMASAQQGVAQSSDQAAAATARAGEAAKKAGRDAKAAAREQKELEDAYLKVGLAAAAVLYGMVRAIDRSIEANNRQVAAFTGLQSVVRGVGEDYRRAQQFVEDFTRDGLVSQAEAAQALKNLLSRGFSLEEAIQMLNRLKDAAAFGRQAQLGLGQAVVTATEGLKNENSVLVDNAGVTKNVSQMWKEYAAQIGKSVNDLTLAEKRQAELNGILEETRHQVGDAAKLTETLAGAQAMASAQAQKTAAAFGRAWEPAIRAATQAKTAALKVLEQLIDRFPGLAVVMSGAVTAAAGLLTGFAAWVQLGPSLTKVATQVATAFRAMSAAMLTNPVFLAIAALAALTYAVYRLSKAQQDAARAAVEHARAQLEAAEALKNKVTQKMEELARRREEIQNRITDIEREQSELRADIARREMERRRDLANRMGEALGSALRQKYEEQLAVEEREYDRGIARLQNFYDERLRKAEDTYSQEVDALERAFDEMAALQAQAIDRIFRDWAMEADRATREAIESKQAEIEAIDNLTRVEEEAQRRIRLQQRIDSLEAKKAQIQDAEELARVEAEIAEARAELQRMIVLWERQMKKEALQREIEDLREQGRQKQEEIQAQWDQARGTFEDYVRAVKEGRQDEARQLLELLPEQVRAVAETEAQKYLAKKAALDQAFLTEKGHLEAMKQLVEENAEQLKQIIRDKYFGENGLLRQDQLYAEAVRMVVEGNQQAILELLNQYEPDWQNQGKDFVDRLAAGVQEAQPGLEEVARGLEVMMQAMLDNISYYADEASQKLAELDQAKREAEATIKEIDRQAAQAHRHFLAVEAAATESAMALKKAEEAAQQAGGIQDLINRINDSDLGEFEWTQGERSGVQGSRHGGGPVPVSGNFRLMAGEWVLSRDEARRRPVLIDASSVLPLLRTPTAARQGEAGRGSVNLNVTVTDPASDGGALRRGQLAGREIIRLLKLAGEVPG